MSVAKVIEVISSSPKGFEEAVANGIAKVSESVHGVQGAWVKEMKVDVDSSGRVSQYRVDLMVTFLVD